MPVSACLCPLTDFRSLSSEYHAKTGQITTSQYFSLNLISRGKQAAHTEGPRNTTFRSEITQKKKYRLEDLQEIRQR
jgi:hypothetical protein